MPRKKKHSPRLAALHYRDFRLVWFGEMVSTTGTKMQDFAINWHVFALLHGQVVTIGGLQLGADALGLGLVGLVRVFPVVVFAMLGGIIADTRDRRLVMLWTRIFAAVVAAVLAVITLAGQESITIIYALTALGAAAGAFDSPSRQSLVPNLVDRKDLTNAVSLNTLIWQVGNIIGPALTGALIAMLIPSNIDTAGATAPIGVIYAVNALSFGAAIVALLALHYRGGPAAQGVKIGWKPMKDGLRFTINSRIILSTMLLDFFATLFASARTMLPIIAQDILGVGPVGYGLLATAEPVGSLIAGSIVALRRDIYHQGRILLISVGLYGLATALFGLSTFFPVSYALFALVGAGDTVSTVIRGTIRQIMTPDHLRGRMVSVTMIFFMGGPQLGELEAGVVASAFGVPFAIFSGGVATVLMTLWIARSYPRLRGYTTDTSEMLLAEQESTLARLGLEAPQVVAVPAAD